MVMCFAPNCKHYYMKHLCKFFRFPADLKLRKKWINIIRREDKVPTSHHRICQCHFKDGKKENGPSIFEHNKDKYFDFSDPEKKTRRRTKNASSSLFLNLPDCHSTPSVNTKPNKNQEVKKYLVDEPISTPTLECSKPICIIKYIETVSKATLECSKPISTTIPEHCEPVSTATLECSEPISIIKCSEPVSTAMPECRKLIDIYDESRTFKTLQELINLSEMILPPWNLIRHNNSVIICYLMYNPAPKIMYSVVIDDSLEMRAYKGDLELNEENEYSFPFSINNIDALNHVLEFLCNLE